MMERSCEACRIGAELKPAPGGVHEVSDHWTINWRVDGPDRPWLVLQTKHHREGLEDLSAVEISELGPSLVLASTALKEQCGCERVYVAMFNELGHVHFHLVPRFESDKSRGAGLLATPMAESVFSLDPEQLVSAIAAKSREAIGTERPPAARDEPHAIVRRVVAAHRWFDGNLSPYGPAMRRFWKPRPPQGFAPVYVACWFGVLLLLLLAAPLWHGSVIASSLISAFALFRWVDLVLYQVGIIVDRTQDLLAGFERSLLLAVGNLAELSLIGAIWLLALDGGPTGPTWLHAFNLVTLTGTATYDGGVEVLAQISVQLAAMVFLAGAVAILIGVLGARFRENPTGGISRNRY